MNASIVAALVTQTFAAAGEGSGGRFAEAVGLGSAALGLLALLALALAVKAGFVAAAVWFDSTFPQAARRMLTAYQERGKRCFLVGLVNAVVVLILVPILIRTEILALLGLLLFGCLVVFIVVGYGIGYRDWGQRLEAASDSRIRQIVLGGLVAECAFLAPILGQLLSLGMLFKGLGAVVIALLARRNNTRQEQRRVAADEESDSS
jgi:hypothetical protein